MKGETSKEKTKAFAFKSSHDEVSDRNARRVCLMGLYWQIFLTFAKIGAFTIGGGYAMLSMIQMEIVERKRWISANDFIEMIALSQFVPGIWTVNIAILTGYRIRKITGSLVATIGAILPSFIMILLIVMFFRRFQDNPYLVKIFAAIRPVIVALISVSVFTIAKSSGISLKAIIIPVTTAFLIWHFRISPIYVMLSAVLCSIGFSMWKQKRKK